MVSIIMQVVNPQIVSGKKVLLRLDIDVPMENGQVIEDFRLKAALPTLEMCLANASEVIVLGHIGRPEGKVVPELSVEPIRQWLPKNKKLTVLENLRFDPREEASDLGFAKELAGMGDIYINEAFASYRPSASTTILPSLLPHCAGLRFAQEVGKLTEVRNNPKKPFIAIMGGAKVKDKLPVIAVLAQKADAVLVGGKLVSEFTANNILMGKLNQEGTDIAPETTESWRNLIMGAKMIVWNGPVGRIEDPNLQFIIYNLQNKTEESLGSARGTYEIAKMILESEAEVVIGGGDTIGFLGKIGLLGKFEQKGFVSTGGGAMLKFLTDGILPTIAALE